MTRLLAYAFCGFASWFFAAALIIAAGATWM